MTGLIQGGGIKTTGSLRNISIRRNGEIITILDLYDYILNGNLNNNIHLQENDVVIVPVRKSIITIDGAVFRQGIYEGIEQESLMQMINYASGLKHNASSQITLKRIVPMNSRNIKESIVRQLLFNIDQLDAINSQNGDYITVHSIAELSNEVRISGQVKIAGIYKLTKNMNMMNLLNLAGGLEDSVFIKTMYLDEINIIRKKEDGEYNETIKVNLQQHLDHNTMPNVKLHDKDLIIVYANKNLLSVNNVKIAGEVNRPGEYALTNQSETLQSIIDRAGGLSNGAFKEGLRVMRDTLNVIWNDYSLTLLGGDSIFVGKKPGVVLVKGEVYNPGLVTYKKGRSVKSYIKTAGGFTHRGNKRDILIISANGDVKPNGHFLFSPKVAEGTTIVINQKPESQPFSLNSLLRDTASIAASLAMIYYVITK